MVIACLFDEISWTVDLEIGIMSDPDAKLIVAMLKRKLTVLSPMQPTIGANRVYVPDQ